MKSMEIKAVIFDWAGVLGMDGYWIWLKKNFPDLEERKTLFRDISEGVDSGRLPHGEFVSQLAKESGKPVDQVWKEVKAEIVLNTELIQLVKKLKMKYKVALLSNFTAPWLSEIITENSLWELFDHHIISSEHKMIKPNPMIFHKMLMMLEISPNEAVFVDDNQRNIDASKELGIESILYKDFEKFKQDLAEVGVAI